MLNSSPASCALPDLLAACLAASAHAGRVIREVARSGEDLAVVNKAAGAYDPQTVADRRAQQRMVFALRQALPLLTIVGEEGELEAPEPEDQVACDVSAASLPALAVPEALGALEWEHLVLWMDPLDGTKRFADQKYDEVSVLLGIAYKQQAVAGVVHLPFQGEAGETYWGGPGLGVFRSANGEHGKVARSATGFPRRPLTVTVSSTNCDLVNAALRSLAPGHVRTGGATGTMVLGVLTGESDLFLRFKAATRKWDICAVEPLLAALGGALVDASTGRPYRYHPTEDPTFDNPGGLLACMDAQLLASALQVVADVRHARTLDGRVATPAWLEPALRTPLSAQPRDVRVAGVETERGSVRHGKHAHVGVLLAAVDGGGGGPGSRVRVFAKRSARAELPPRPDALWRRDLASYRNEAAFYARVHGLLRPRVPLLGVYAVHARPDASLLLLECADADELEARDRLGTRDARAALAYLASLHAAAATPTAGGGVRAVDRARGELWAAGGWWTLDKRGEAELRQAARVWPEVLAAFADELAAAGVDPADAQVATLGDRLVACAPFVSAQLAADGLAAETLVHGDLKAANLFFGRRSDAVVAFDWQWAGRGLGAQDVAYLLATSVAMDALTGSDAVVADAVVDADDPFAAALDAGEAALLRYYYARLAVEAPRVTADYPFAAFRRHYALATLDYARVLASAFWAGMTPASCRAKAARANCGLAYRSAPHAVRMARRMHLWIAAVDDERFGSSG